MPNSKAHRTIGGIAGFGAGAYVARGDSSSYSLATLLGGTVGGIIGGSLPDILEPATSPNHRRIAHAVLPASVIVVICMKWWIAQIDSCLVKAKECEANQVRGVDWNHAAHKFVAGLLAGLAVGYASHLALDAMTPRSLPFI